MQQTTVATEKNAVARLLDMGMPLNEIERLKTDLGFTYDQITAAAEKRVANGESLVPATDAAEAVQIDGARLSIAVAEAALDELGVTVRYNQLNKTVEVSGLPSKFSTVNAPNVLPTYLADHLKSRGVKGVNRQAVVDCLEAVADIHRYNPVEQFLTSGAWDGVDRTPELLRILGVSKQYDAYISKWLLQCVALGLNDEDDPVSAEGVLVLQGPQGCGKTSVFRILSPFKGAFVEGAVIDLRVKDSVISATRGWITELGELDATVRREQVALKSFITLPRDSIRLPYAKTETASPRRTSFCGTVNPEDFLRDETGSRRFWVVPVSDIDKAALFSLDSEWINQLWYQFYWLYTVNPNGFRLTDEELRTIQERNRSFEQSLPYELEIRELCDFALPVARWEWWSAAELAKHLGPHADARQVGRALAKVARDAPSVAGLSENTEHKMKKKARGNRLYCVPILKTWRNYSAAGQ